MKAILLLCTLIVTILPCNALLDINVTNVIAEGLQPNCVGGNNVITPHNHYWDSWFALHNEGYISYQIYMYDYVGEHPDKYTDAFIGSINPNQMIMLNNNASYRIYASYNEIRDITDVETVKKKFNQWWLIIVIFVVLLIGFVKVWKVITR